MMGSYVINDVDKENTTKKANGSSLEAWYSDDGYYVRILLSLIL